MSMIVFWNGYFKLLSSTLSSGWLLFQRTLIIIVGNIVAFIRNEAFAAEKDFQKLWNFQTIKADNAINVGNRRMV